MMDELVQLKGAELLSSTASDINVAIEFKFDTEYGGFATICISKHVIVVDENDDVFIPGWVLEEKQFELCADGNYKTCEILIVEES